MDIKLKVLIFIVLLSIIFISATPKIEEKHIKAEIEEANYCETDADCVDAGGKCPFGCWVYVNKNEVERISKIIDSYDSKCVYDCLYCPTAKCENKRCVEVCDQP